MANPITVSLVIPVFNESQTVLGLIATIKTQTFQPNEIILVDGGSTDNTVQLIKDLTVNDSIFRIIEAGRAMPGKGRNIGSALAANDWIAYTDAGIILDNHWLENLVTTARKNPGVSIVYGNYAPQVNNFFQKCAAISYVPPFRPGYIIAKSIVSCLLWKEVWVKTGGFPDWRAAEDLIFMEKAESLGYKYVNAPEARVFWQLSPDLKSTFKKFDLYSKYNVWANREAYWHYGVAKHYFIVLASIFLSFIYSYWWLLIIPAWFGARVFKRVFMHRFEIGLKPLINPLVIISVLVITLTIDVATFSGWIKALIQKKPGT